MYISDCNLVAPASLQVYTIKMLSSVVYDPLMIEALLTTAYLPQEKQGKYKFNVIDHREGTYIDEFTKPYEMWIVKIDNDKDRKYFVCNREESRISLEYFKTDTSAFRCWSTYEQRYAGNNEYSGRKARTTAPVIRTGVGDIEATQRQQDSKNDRRGTRNQPSDSAVSHGQSVLEIGS